VRCSVCPGILIRHLYRNADLPADIFNAGQLLGDIVEQRVVSEAGLVHFGGGNRPHVGQYPLARTSVQCVAVVEAQRGQDGKGGLVVPTIAAEPLRLRTLVEIDALRKRVLVHRRLRCELIIAEGQPARRADSVGHPLEKHGGPIADAVGGNLIIRK